MVDFPTWIYEVVFVASNSYMNIVGFVKKVLVVVVEAWRRLMWWWPYGCR